MNVTEGKGSQGVVALAEETEQNSPLHTTTIFNLALTQSHWMPHDDSIREPQVMPQYRRLYPTLRGTRQRHEMPAEGAERSPDVRRLTLHRHNYKQAAFTFPAASSFQIFPSINIQFRH
jgi:hypothetical protein